MGPGVEQKGKGLMDMDYSVVIEGRVLWGLNVNKNIKILNLKKDLTKCLTKLQ